MPRLLPIIFIFIGLQSCSYNNNKHDKGLAMENGKLQQHLVNANKIVIKNESDAIDNYIKKHQWKMQETGTGLRYMIYKNGQGKKAITGNTIKLKFSVELLDSTVCYAAKDMNPLEFVVNQSDQIRGLHELAGYLKKGDMVKAIMPPHLAYGIAGDNDQIPPRAILVFDIEVLDLK